jgi:hypothetical protein
MPNADLFDIPNPLYLLEKLSHISFFKEEMILKCHSFKAAGSDAIPSFILMCYGCLLASYFKPLVQACIDISYHSTACCNCNTVPLR